MLFTSLVRRVGRWVRPAGSARSVARGKGVVRVEKINGDLISREDALRALKGVIARTGLHGVAIEVILANLDSVEAEPVVHAHWFMGNPEIISRGYCCEFTCSNCGGIVELDHAVKECDYERCPRCGAHMDEEVADEA